MPTVIGITPPTDVTYSIQDANAFTRMPVQMAAQELNAYEYSSVWGNQFGSMRWKQNNGDIVVGVMPQRSPVTSQTHRPNNITSQAKINTYRNRELQNQARIKRHKYMSQQINWIPDFRDFRKNVMFQIGDIAHQISVSNDFFIRDQLLHLARHAYHVGRGSSTDNAYDETVPYGDPTDPTANVKDANWVAARIQELGTGTLDFRTICAIRDMAGNDIGLAPMEGWKKGNPRDNEAAKGKYVLIGASELWTRLTYDTTVNNVKPLAEDLIHSRFKGTISDNILFRHDPLPLRFKEDGSLPDIQIEQEYNDANYSGDKGYITRFHPDYRKAPVGVAFLIGYNPIETIDVGPPPSEFTGKGMSLNKYNALNWNGQVQATRNFLVKDSAGNLEANTWDEHIKLIASTVHGVMPVNPFNVLPIFYRRGTSEALAW